MPQQNENFLDGSKIPRVLRFESQSNGQDGKQYKLLIKNSADG